MQNDCAASVVAYYDAMSSAASPDHDVNKRACVQALVLAGRRASGDQVADSSGLRHRALLPIGGVPMLERVVDAIEDSAAASGIAVSSDDPDLIRSTPRLAALAARASDGGAAFLSFHRSSTSPASSVADYFTAASAPRPLFVTTGDHPLLTGEIIRHFVAQASASDADFLVGMVPASVYHRRFPDQPRTFLSLRGEKYSGANLFMLRTDRAAEVARFWVRAEAYRKTPWKLVREFGRMNLAMFLLGRLDLDAALERASEVVGARIRAVVMPFAEAALDVDKEADRICAEAVFAERALAAES
jgi:GTP:adenosylcobinamide-phosphate guanylyltransferase